MATFITPITVNGPAREAEAVTPSDATNYSGNRVARAFYVGTTGNVVVIPAGQTAAVTFTAVPAGAIIPIWHTRINSTNTTASNIVAMF